MPIYNPYSGSRGGGNYVELPYDMPASMMDNYYRAVLASQQRPDPWAQGLENLGKVGMDYFGQVIKQQFGQETADNALQRELQKLLFEKQWAAQIEGDKDARERSQTYEDYANLGRAGAAWADVFQPGPDHTETVETPGYQSPPEDVNLPGEPGGYAQIPGEVFPGETVTRTVPGERPVPIDAWRRFAGQFPEYAGLLQSKTGATFGQSVLDPTFQSNRSSLIRERETRANKAEATTNPEVARIIAQANAANARANASGIKADETEFTLDLRRKARELYDIGTPEAVKKANAIMAVVNGRPWESAADREGARYDARTSRGLPADKPQRAPSMRGPSDTRIMMEKMIALENKPDRTPQEENELRLLKQRLLTGDAFKQIMADILRRSQQGQGGGSGLPNIPSIGNKNK